MPNLELTNNEAGNLEATLKYVLFCDKDMSDDRSLVLLQILRKLIEQSDQ